jgi:fatty acid synthase
VAFEETRAGTDAAEAEPARWFAAFAPAPSPTVALPQPSPVHVEQAAAPWNLAEFARASHDANPLHRDAHAAALAGFDRPIVHGQWTAARAVAAVSAGFAGTDGERIRGISATFTDVVLPGDPLELRARHAGMQRGDLLVDVEAHAGPPEEGRLALRGRVRVAGPRTAYVFPGQGVQTTGMGMEGYARSAAARRVWDAADAHCRERLGFSLLTVVRDNPLEMRVGPEILRHEQGVLFLTQFTQVGMAVLACAQIAELREAGCFQEDAPFCGHSVGEYSAIGAITDALSLTAVVDTVYQRGLTMQHYVPRDAQGRSAYRMAVVRPNIVGLDEAALNALVARVARETGLLCEVVNYNIRGRQYSVVGHVPALEALRAALRALEPSGAKSSYLEVPGIDVPFHSRALRDGVGAFREKLEAIVPLDLDVGPLVGRYIPNLTARFFEVSRAYLDDIIGCTESAVLTALRDRWDAEAAPPAELGRALFIEGLAYQFASPVRWIETQDLLLARDRTGVARVIEIGLGSAPTQANMFRVTQAMDPSRLDPPAVLNVEADRKAVFSLYDAEAEAVLAGPSAPAAPAPAAKPTASAPAAPAQAAPAPAGAISDVAPTVREGLLTLLALKARVRDDEIKADENIELLSGGNSSRRNQIMADLGNEFGIGSIDAAHEMPLGTLVAAVEKATQGRYKAPGPYLRAQITAALKPFGLSVKDVLQAMASRGLPEGRALSMLLRTALWLRAGESTRAGALAPLPLPGAGDRGAAAGWLDAALGRYATEAGFSLAAGGGGGRGRHRRRRRARGPARPLLRGGWGLPRVAALRRGRARGATCGPSWRRRPSSPPPSRRTSASPATTPSTGPTTTRPSARPSPPRRRWSTAAPGPGPAATPSRSTTRSARTRGSPSRRPCPRSWAASPEAPTPRPPARSPIWSAARAGPATCAPPRFSPAWAGPSTPPASRPPAARPCRWRPRSWSRATVVSRSPSDCAVSRRRWPWPASSSRGVR